MKLVKIKSVLIHVSIFVDKTLTAKLSTIIQFVLVDPNLLEILLLIVSQYQVIKVILLLYIQTHY